MGDVDELRLREGPEQLRRAEDLAQQRVVELREVGALPVQRTGAVGVADHHLHRCGRRRRWVALARLTPDRRVERGERAVPVALRHHGLDAREAGPGRARRVDESGRAPALRRVVRLLHRRVARLRHGRRRRRRGGRRAAGEGERRCAACGLTKACAAALQVARQGGRDDDSYVRAQRMSGSESLPAGG